MRADSLRWHEISPSEFDHEREGLAGLRELLPDRAPFQAWTNFEFRDRDGKWHEVDALVLGERRLYLIELKHYQGTITGNAYRWRRARRSEVSPLLLTRRKAQQLKSVIVDALAGLQPDLGRQHIPFVQQCVFLHAPNGRCALPPSDAADLFGLDDAESSSGLPSIAQRVLEPPEPGGRAGLIDHDELVVALFERIGFALRSEREVGSWRLTGAPVAEGDGWQDWPAEHKLVHRDAARIRFFVSRPGASEAERRGTRQLAEREYELTRRLHHDSVLLPCDLVEDDLGVGLVYPHDDAYQRLDLWLSDHGEQLPLPARVDMIRQLAEALAYAHRHHVVHRGLTAAVLVRRRDQDIEVRLGDWQVAGADQPGSSRSPSGAATRLFAAMEGRDGVDPERQRAEAYLAPEGRWWPGADRVRLDVFALGAVAYHVVAGQVPTIDAVDLRERIVRDGGLDLAADIPEVPAPLRALVQHATRPAVSERLADVQAFLALLGEVDKELAATADGIVEDPLDASPGMLVEPEPLKIGQRTALLLDSAGETTLAEVLRERPRLSLDLLERYGTDLCEALVGLDKTGIEHRDIKPANLGVREQRGERGRPGQAPGAVRLFAVAGRCLVGGGRHPGVPGPVPGQPDPAAVGLGGRAVHRGGDPVRDGHPAGPPLRRRPVQPIGPGRGGECRAGPFRPEPGSTAGRVS